MISMRPKEMASPIRTTKTRGMLLPKYMALVECDAKATEAGLVSGLNVPPAVKKSWFCEKILEMDPTVFPELVVKA